jgi:glyoxylase-like metal-dependent hydrolase (beta-lactamase superfamily II)
MFGVVPKVFWERKAPADTQNRIKLGLNCLLIQGKGKNILIDTGCGFKYSPKELEIYGIQHETTVLEGLRRIGVSPADIDFVINTHLHFDHCGGNTREVDGELVPTFPNATFIVQAQELEEANQPTERNRASYIKHNWAPLVENGQLELVDGVFSLIPEIECIPTPGHTLGHQSVKLQSGGRSLFFLGDLCPTSAHVPLPWIMSYDLYPVTTLDIRRGIYKRAVAEGWTLFFEHDPQFVMGMLEETDGKYEVRVVEWEG